MTTLLIDGTSVAYRAYYGFAKSKEGGLVNGDGISTSVCFGFMKTLLMLIKKYNPQRLGIAFDTGKTFRNDLYENYKSHRKETPEDFIIDLKNLKSLLRFLGIQVIEAPGYEADDILYTLAQSGGEIKVASGDYDLLQMVNNNIKIIHLTKQDLIEYHQESVKEKFGICPKQFPDYKALCGDKSDNIPGVKGIGEVTAKKLLTEFPTIEVIYNNLEQIPEKHRKKLEVGRKDAEVSKILATLVRVADLQEVGEFQIKLSQEAVDLLQRLGLRIILAELSKLTTLTQPAQPKQPSKPPIQKDEFTATLESAQIENFIKFLVGYDQPVAWSFLTDKIGLLGVGAFWNKFEEQSVFIPLKDKSIIFKLKPALEQGGTKYIHDAKSVQKVLHKLGIKLGGVIVDPQLLSYIINPEQDHSILGLAKQFGQPPQKSLAWELKVVFLASTELSHQCHKDSRLSALNQLEHQLSDVLLQMELRGVKIDVGYLQKLAQQINEGIQILEQKIFSIAGEAFNVASPQQVSHILFNKLKFDPGYSRPNQNGYSTDAGVLEKLQEMDQTGIITNILNHRTLAKLKSTYVDALPNLISPTTKKIHTTYTQTETATGRLSSLNPNLQNIPIRTAFSRQIRKAFLPEFGWLMVAADYSQIELRILAHLSQEPVLLQAYRNNEDVHALTAKLIFDRKEITPEERRFGKTINFGIIYGMGVSKLALSTGITIVEAKELYGRFVRRIPRAFAYLESLKKQAIAYGYTETILGRRRYFNFHHAELRRQRGMHWEDVCYQDLTLGGFDAAQLRACANAPIQGSSADIIKAVMNRLHHILQKYQARLLLQVHDELVFEVPFQEWEELQPQIKSVMEGTVRLSVPLIVELKVGENWLEAK